MRIVTQQGQEEGAHPAPRDGDVGRVGRPVVGADRRAVPARPGPRPARGGRTAGGPRRGPVRRNHGRRPRARGARVACGRGGGGAYGLLTCLLGRRAVVVGPWWTGGGGRAVVDGRTACAVSRARPGRARASSDRAKSAPGQRRPRHGTASLGACPTPTRPARDRPVAGRPQPAAPEHATVPRGARVVVLVSGAGTNLAALLAAQRAPGYPARVVAVMSDRPDAGGLDVARAAGVATVVVRPADFADRAALGRGAGAGGRRASTPRGWCARASCASSARRSSPGTAGGCSTPTPRCCRRSPGRTPCATRSPTASR